MGGIIIMGRMFDTPTLPRLAELLEEVRVGSIQIPEFQRGYIWNDDQRLQLMDSIWQGIPIGSLLVWSTSRDKGLKVARHIGPLALASSNKVELRGYLVDGLQRITTLYTALMPLPEGHERDEHGRRWPIYFDLEPNPGDDLRFRLRHGQQSIPLTWLPLSCLLNDNLFLEFREKLAAASRKDLLDEARRLETRFRDYVVPVIPLVSNDPNLITEAFARVNSLGARMDEGDMAHALTLEGNFSLNAELDNIREQLVPMGWESLDRQIIINILKAIWNLDIYKAGAKGIQAKLKTKEGRELLHRLPDILWPAAEMLRSMGVYGPGSLPYAYQLVAIARAAYRLHVKVFTNAQAELRRWFFWTTYGEHFTGMTSSQLRIEFDLLEEFICLTRELDWIPRPVAGPVRKLRASAVRSRAAVLVMAIIGDREAGGEIHQQKSLYGSLGTDALHRIFPTESAYELANRVIVTDRELKTLRDWIRIPNKGFPGFDVEPLDLLRKNLISINSLNTTRKLLDARTERLEREERNFVKELGIEWNPDQEE